MWYVPEINFSEKTDKILKLKKKNFMACFLDGVQQSQGCRATTKRQFTFYHSVARSFWYSVDRSWKAELTGNPVP